MCPSPRRALEAFDTAASTLFALHVAQQGMFHGRCIEISPRYRLLYVWPLGLRRTKSTPPVTSSGQSTQLASRALILDGFFKHNKHNTTRREAATAEGSRGCWTTPSAVCPSTGHTAHALPQESVRLVRPLWLSDVCHHLQLTRRHFPIVSALIHLPGMA